MWTSIVRGFVELRRATEKKIAKSASSGWNSGDTEAVVKPPPPQARTRRGDRARKNPAVGQARSGWVKGVLQRMILRGPTPRTRRMTEIDGFAGRTTIRTMGKNRRNCSGGDLGGYLPVSGMSSMSVEGMVVRRNGEPQMAARMEGASCWRGDRKLCDH